MSDYKKFSLEKLDEWIHDTLQNDDLTPSEIVNQIVSTAQESYEYHTKYAKRCKDFLNLIRKQERKVSDMWEEYYYPEEYQKSKSPTVYTDEELNAMCDAAESEQEKEVCKEYNTRELEYASSNQKVAAINYEEAIAAGWELTADGFWWPPQQSHKQNDKVKKWVLPVQSGYVDGIDDYFVQFPDDLLNETGWNEGDTLEWSVNKDGLSYTLKKVSNEK